MDSFSANQTRVIFSGILQHREIIESEISDQVTDEYTATQQVSTGKANERFVNKIYYKITLQVIFSGINPKVYAFFKKLLIVKQILLASTLGNI